MSVSRASSKRCSPATRPATCRRSPISAPLRISWQGGKGKARAVTHMGFPGRGTTGVRPRWVTLRHVLGWRFGLAQQRTTRVITPHALHRADDRQHVGGKPHRLRPPGLAHATNGAEFGRCQGGVGASRVSRIGVLWVCRKSTLRGRSGCKHLRSAVI
jgi:hypothetical protein